MFVVKPWALTFRRCCTEFNRDGSTGGRLGLCRNYDFFSFRARYACWILSRRRRFLFLGSWIDCLFRCQRLSFAGISSCWCLFLLIFWCQSFRRACFSKLLLTLIRCCASAPLSGPWSELTGHSNRFPTCHFTLWSNYFLLLLNFRIASLFCAAIASLAFSLLGARFSSSRLALQF